MRIILSNTFCRNIFKAWFLTYTNDTYYEIEMFGIEEHEGIEQNMWRVSTQLFTFPEMLLFYSRYDEFCKGGTHEILSYL